MLAFGDRPLDDSERTWLEGEVRAAFRARSALSRMGDADPAVIVYEEKLDEDVVRSLEKKRGPAPGSGWRGFYDLAAVDAKLPPDQVLDAGRFLADRSRRKVIVPLFMEEHGVAGQREGSSGAPRAPLADFWEGEAEKHEPFAKEIRRALHERWGLAARTSEYPPPRGSA